MHRRLTIAGAVLATSMAAAAPAVAQTASVPLSFNHVVLDTPGTGMAQLVSASTKPLTVTANVDPTTGNFTVDPSGFTAPTYSFSSPVPGTASIALAKTASGAVNFSTGGLTMNADFLATINLGSFGSCTIDTGVLALSTATTQPLPGQAFPAGATGVATGNGAFGVGWSTLPAGTGSGCSLVNSSVDGKGGIWISRGISPTSGPAVPKLSLTAPHSAKVRAGRNAVVHVTLFNHGTADRGSVSVCLAASKPLSVARRCVTVVRPKAGSKRSIAFVVRTRHARPGTYRLILRASHLKPETVALKIVR